MTLATAQSLDGSLRRAIDQIGIPPCPAILSDLAGEIGSTEPDFGRLAALIERDVALSAGLMKVANSPWFGRRIGIQSVHQAVIALGLNLSGQTIAGLLLRRAFPATPEMRQFWAASSASAQLTGWLARQVSGRADCGEAYTFGLFRDCGTAVMLSRLPGYSQTLATAITSDFGDRTVIEDRRHGCNHAQVGSLLAHSWGLAEAFCTAVRYHHQDAALRVGEPAVPQHSLVLIALALLADAIRAELAGRGDDPEWQRHGDAVESVLGITAGQRERLAGLAREFGHRH